MTSSLKRVKPALAGARLRFSHTLPRYTATSRVPCTARSRHADTPSPGACMSGVGPVTRVTAPIPETFLPAKGVGSFTVGDSYILHEILPTAGLLKRPGRGASAGHCPLRQDVGGSRSYPDCCHRRWALPHRDGETRTRISQSPNRFLRASLSLGYRT